MLEKCEIYLQEEVWLKLMKSPQRESQRSEPRKPISSTLLLFLIREQNAHT